MKFYKFSKSKKEQEIHTPEIVAGHFKDNRFICCDVGTPGAEVFIDVGVTDIDRYSDNFVRIFVTQNGWLQVNHDYENVFYVEKPEPGDCKINERTRDEIFRKIGYIRNRRPMILRNEIREAIQMKILGLPS